MSASGKTKSKSLRVKTRAAGALEEGDEVGIELEGWTNPYQVG
jgi:hypothetical protein